MVLQDGSYVYIHNNMVSFSTEEKHGHISQVYYDINGSAGPNRAGYVFFNFYTDTEKNRMEPMLYYLSKVPGNVITIDDCNKNSKYGYDCAAKILKNEKY